MKNLLLITLALLLSILTIGATQQPKPQWEYKIEQKCFDESKINGLGSDGWELAGFHEGDRGGWHCIFKRPKS